LTAVATRRLRTACAALLTGLPLLAFAVDPTRIAPIAPSPLAAPAELVERQFGPLRAFQIQAKLRAMGLQNASGIKLADERMLLRAPDKPAADGRYGLLVYLDSRAHAQYDFTWSNVLDSHAVILVSPDNAGDDAASFDRRIPLALAAYEYARRTYNLDPDRVYIAGDGSGSRIAQNLAVSFPDVFSGAIVNSGAVELGTQALPVPAPALLERLRTHSRLVFATSSHDEPAFTEQRRTLKSMGAYCVPGAEVFENGHTLVGHAAINGLFLNDFLDSLAAPHSAAMPGQAACEDALRRDANAALEDIRQLHASGRQDDALKALVDFDSAYGRLLVEDEVALVKQINPTFFAPSAPAASAASATSH
jgi:pimeloyl-ACP methyl ester carboxylesterase